MSLYPALIEKKDGKEPPLEPKIRPKLKDFVLTDYRLKSAGNKI